MFKEIQSAFTKFFTGQRIIIFIILLILAFALMTYSNSKSLFFDGMADGSMPPMPPMDVSGNVPSKTGGQNGPVPQPSQLQAVSQQVLVPNTNSIYNLQSVANPSDLLPQDKNSQWATLNPTLNPNNVIIPDLLEAGYHIGLDTIGQTLRNANYQERSDPIIPKTDVGPWNQSTVEPDIGRVALDLGYGCK
jgi:hypothetical protein